MKILVCLFILLSYVGISQTDEVNHVVWNVRYVEISATEGEIVFTALAEKGWHIYSTIPSTTSGVIPTSFTITPNPNFELVNGIIEQNPREMYVKAFSSNEKLFFDKVPFIQKVIRKNPGPFIINTALEFMTCDDIVCSPPTIVTSEVRVIEVSKKFKKK